MGQFGDPEPTLTGPLITAGHSPGTTFMCIWKCIMYNSFNFITKINMRQTPQSRPPHQLLVGRGVVPRRRKGKAGYLRTSVCPAHHTPCGLPAALSIASARLGSRSVLSMAGPGLYLFPQLLHASTSSAPTAAGLLPTFPILAPISFAKIPPFLGVGARRVGDFSRKIFFTSV